MRHGAAARSRSPRAPGRPSGRPSEVPASSRTQRSPRLAGDPRRLRAARAARRRGTAPRWYRVGGSWSAVAAGLLVLTLVLPHAAQSDDAGGRRPAGAQRFRGETPRPASCGRPRARDPARDTTTTPRGTALIAAFAAEDSSVDGDGRRRRAPRCRWRLRSRGADRDKALACIVQSVARRDGRPHSALHPGAVRGDARVPGGLHRGPRRGPARRPGHHLGRSRPTTVGSFRPPSRSSSRHARHATLGNRRAFPPMGGLGAMADTRNVIVIGSGPAGYTAALYAARANLDTARAQGPRRRRPADAHDRRRELPRLRRRHPRPRADGADGEAGGAVRRRDPARCT